MTPAKGACRHRTKPKAWAIPLRAHRAHMFFEGGSMRSAGFNRVTTPWAGASDDLRATYKFIIATTAEATTAT